MMNLKNSLDDVFQKARKKDLDVDVRIKRVQTISASTAQRKIESTTAQLTHHVELNVYKDGFTASAHSESLKPQDLNQTFEEAHQLLTWLKDSTPQPSIPAQMYPEVSNVEPLVFPLGSIPSLEGVMRWSLEQEDICLSRSPWIEQVAYNSVAFERTQRLIANSKGQFKEEMYDLYHANCSPVLHDENRKIMLHNARAARTIDSLNIQSFSESATDRVLSNKGAQSIPSEIYDAVLSTHVSASFLHLLISAFSARAVQSGRSIFTGKLHKSVASSLLNLVDNPRDTEGDGAESFDDEGASTSRRVLIENGILKSYLTDWASSLHLKIPHTASAGQGISYYARFNGGITTRNLSIEPKDRAPFSTLIQGPRVLVVESISALHSGYNYISGAFSFPARGILYQNGERQTAVQDFAVSGTLADLLMNIEAIGDAETHFQGGTRGSALRVRGLHVSGLNS